MCREEESVKTALAFDGFVGFLDFAELLFRSFLDFRTE